MTHIWVADDAAADTAADVAAAVVSVDADYAAASAAAASLDCLATSDASLLFLEFWSSCRRPAAASAAAAACTLSFIDCTSCFEVGALSQLLQLNSVRFAVLS